MMYVKTINGVLEKFPYNIGDFRKDNPTVSFPAIITDDMLSIYGVYRVHESAIPEIDRFTENLRFKNLPEKINNVWILECVVEKKSQEEAESSIRQERDRLLQETDWMALSDNKLTPEWAAYRSALRNLPQSPNFPWNVTWPTKP